MTALLVLLGGGTGASVRYLAGHYLDHRFASGTLLVNVLGSFLLGLVTALSPGAGWLALLGTGFCGGLTTYSAFVVKTHERGAEGGTRYAVATLALALPACFLGHLLG